jgi:flavin-dependent dehydrogenase
LLRRASTSTCSVAVIGGGIAGCAMAMALCRQGVDDILIVEAGAYDTFQIGESIPPDCRLLLEGLHIWQDFLEEKHSPCFGSRSAWGTDIVGYNDFLLNPHGTGWHLDRRQFGAFMARKAIQSGAELRIGTRCLAAKRSAGKVFELELKASDGSRQCVRTQFVVDATGARCWLAKIFGARPRAHDRLIWIGAVLNCPAALDFSKLTMVEAAETGWWYAAGLPGERVLVASITDAETNKQAMLHQPGSWLAHLRKTAHMANWLQDCSCGEDRRLIIRSAPSFVLDRVCGSRWLAVGDAASAYDPITSQGIYKALFDGLQSATALTKHLSGARGAFAEYQSSVVDRFTDYQKNRNYLYELEQRWSSAPFWRNRRQRVGGGFAGGAGL